MRAFLLAEREGFEPSVLVRGRRFSRPVQSTALPPLRVARMRCEYSPSAAFAVDESDDHQRCHRQLRAEQARKHRQQNERTQRLAHLERHGQRIPGGLAQRGRADFDEPERARDRRNLVGLHGGVHAEALTPAASGEAPAQSAPAHRFSPVGLPRSCLPPNPSPGGRRG